MALGTHVSAVVGITLALVLTSAYKDPPLLVRLLGREPSHAVFGLNQDLSQTRLETQDRRRLYRMDCMHKARKQIAWEVIRGERSLVEAAACFQFLAERVPWRRAPWEEPDSMALCRQVIHWVKTQEQEPENPQISRALSRLETELREVQRGAVDTVLPSISPAALEVFREPSWQSDFPSRGKK